MFSYYTSVLILCGITLVAMSILVHENGRISLYTIMFLVVAGITVQELFSGNRTACMGMTIGAVLMFIHYTEFAHLDTDEKMSEQRIHLMLSQIKPHFGRESLIPAISIIVCGT